MLPELFKRVHKPASPEVFWGRVNKSDGCWLWIGPKFRVRAATPNDPLEYGRVGSMRYAHRVSWELSFGPIPKSLQVLHRCDVPLCVRPDHLFLGTNKDNMLDKVNKQRVPRGEKCSWAKLTENDVIKIRAAHATGETQAALAHRFNLHRSTINDIVLRKNWKWLP